MIFETFRAFALSMSASRATAAMVTLQGTLESVSARNPTFESCSNLFAAIGKPVSYDLRDGESFESHARHASGATLQTMPLLPSSPKFTHPA